MTIRKLFLAILILGLPRPFNALAQSFREEGLRIGPEALQEFKTMHVGQSSSLAAVVSQEARYDSNIFLDTNNKKHDLIGVTTPRFLLDVPMGIDERHLFQLLYKADAAAYSNFKNQNYVNQDLSANLNLRLPFGYWNLQNGFKDTVERADTEFTTQFRRREDISQTRLGVAGNKLSYELGYTHYLRDYYDRQLDTLNFTEDILGTTVFYQLFPQTQALLEYGHGIINYAKDETRKGAYDQVSLGLKGDLTSKIAGLVKLGYQKRDYDAASRTGFTGFISETGVAVNFSERTVLDLKYVRNAVESISSFNNYYNLNSVVTTLKQKLGGRFTLILSSRFDLRDYPEANPVLDLKEKNKVLTEGVTFRYDLKTWGRIGLGYQYSEEISNIDNKDYNDNLFTLRFDILL